MLLEFPTEDVLREHVVFELRIPWWTFVQSDEYKEWALAHELLASGWDETKHPRHPAGSEAGGEFMPKWGEADLARLDAKSAEYDAEMAHVHDKLASEGTAGLDWRSARAEFDQWAAGMEQWYDERQGFTPDYWPTEREELWRRYQDAVVGEGVPLKGRLDQSGVWGVTVQPQLSSASGGDMDVILDPDRELSPDFNVEMPGTGPEGLRPGFTVWTYPDDTPDVIEDIIPLDDRDYFPGGPESQTAQDYTKLLDAAAGRPSVVDPTPVTMYRGMSDREINAWDAGEEIPAGKYFTSKPTTGYAQDIPGEPPVLQQFRVPRDMLIEIAPGEFQLRKRARMRDGRIEAVTGAAWEEQKHPRRPRGSDRGGEFAPKVEGQLIGVHEAMLDETDDYLNRLSSDLDYEQEFGNPRLDGAEQIENELLDAAAVKDEMQRTLDTIDRLHSLPADADRIELLLGDTGPNWGEHYAERTRTVPPVLTSKKITINPGKDIGDQAGIMAHEFGHYVDVQLGDGSQPFSASEDAVAWRDAVHRSEAVKVLKAMAERRSTDPYAAYLLSDSELWARSYAQWVASRSGDGQLMGSVRFLGARENLPERQWDDVDFGPIATQIDKVMEPWTD